MKAYSCGGQELLTTCPKNSSAPPWSGLPFPWPPVVPVKTGRISVHTSHYPTRPHSAAFILIEPRFLRLQPQRLGIAGYFDGNLVEARILETYPPMDGFP